MHGRVLGVGTKMEGVDMDDGLQSKGKRFIA
jgi:hypothetical protein